MLNIRKLKQDFSSLNVSEGKKLYETKSLSSAKIISLSPTSICVTAQVVGQFSNTYECEFDIDRIECEIVDSNCDCPQSFDCPHLASLLFYLEDNLDAMIVGFSKSSVYEDTDDESSLLLQDQVAAAVTNENIRKNDHFKRQLLSEYSDASRQLAESSFFSDAAYSAADAAELSLIYVRESNSRYDISIALRLKTRSKPLFITSICEFVEALREEKNYISSGRSYMFCLDSFESQYSSLIKVVLSSLLNSGSKEVRGGKAISIDSFSFGMILEESFKVATDILASNKQKHADETEFVLPLIFTNSLETPLKTTLRTARLEASVEYLEPPVSKILLAPRFQVDDKVFQIEDVELFESLLPGVTVEGVYYKFAPGVTRSHIKDFIELRSLTVPEHLFGSFIENGIPKLSNVVDIKDIDTIDSITTLPFTDKLSGNCQLSYLECELEASLYFTYNGLDIPVSREETTLEHLDHFIDSSGILARNLVEEKKIVDTLFDGFLYDKETGRFISKSERRIIEFMTDTLLQFKSVINFNCPQNLLDQFVYDNTTFTLHFSENKSIDSYTIDLGVSGPLDGVRMEQVLDCVMSNRTYIDINSKNSKASQTKVLVLDVSYIKKVAQLFDELGIEDLISHKVEKPLWTLANITEESFEGLPVVVTMSKALQDIRNQMIDGANFVPSPIPKSVKAELRSYQIEGVAWIERLRLMRLGGVLADDMGLGKTLQSIVAITQFHDEIKDATSLVVCPTSLLYNWYEEFSKFAPHLKVTVVDGTPAQRKRVLDTCRASDVLITSYSLMQKDVELYSNVTLGYTILDEAHHIKNRTTRNARSVKQLTSTHKLVLSGTPIENALEELWSLFDFLMPRFLNSYERFIDKYIKTSGEESRANLSYLRFKIAPFITRRMKEDVLEDLPSISEITYKCQLTSSQKELYSEYATSARNELTRLVEKSGFDKVQIHVLATLTRLKQICCHPAIFAKEVAERNDSAKYDMLIELVQSLVDGGHKAVIFSQYTKMLRIMKKDFEDMGISLVYLDGSTKNRMDLVNSFNNDSTISLFLVSLKAGGTGLNLTGADTVIHYDMWWNPAVENQATDRVHRMGQKRNVSVYKLVTLSTIEEKIVELQKRKQGLVQKVISCDEEMLSKLTWEDVLELLEG